MEDNLLKRREIRRRLGVAVTISIGAVIISVIASILISEWWILFTTFGVWFIMAILIIATLRYDIKTKELSTKRLFDSMAFNNQAREEFKKRKF